MNADDSTPSILDTLDPGVDPQLIGLGLALCLGLIVGLEREWSQDKPLGLRSFGIIGLLGGLSALLLPETGAWVVAAGLVGLCILLGAWMNHEEMTGATTMMAAPVVYLLGAAAVAGHWLAAVVTAGAVTLLLHWKQRMHGLVDRLGERDIEIVARFILITLVILPVLPDRTFGPYDVFNPFQAWMLVVLIVAINLAGYVALRLFGTGAGGWLSGILGGLVSSTATTLSYAGMSREHPRFGGPAAIVILVASIVVYPRMLLELSIVAPDLVLPVLWPSAAFAAVLLAMATLVQLRSADTGQADVPERENPAGIGMALSFGGLYVLLLFAVAAGRDLMGDQALYVVALLSGLMDVDALTLSVGQVFNAGEISSDTAWRAIFLAAWSNLVFKTGAAALLGSRELRRWILLSAVPALAIGGALVLLWP